MFVELGQMGIAFAQTVVCHLRLAKQNECTEWSKKFQAQGSLSLQRKKGREVADER